ncbi:hypothetical protein GCM10011487_47950 [Steroidobacter agaridevorans]|uniref:Uncharacterized protein n=1 Tax=Steroidobacter agaridevorans TaxID=2695856 RepID=A0A829YH66_9GAMM|nr:hypothetical protein GCM10011487_47950 [Steroidobacter agaridevorans]
MHDSAQFLFDAMTPEHRLLITIDGFGSTEVPSEGRHAHKIEAFKFDGRSEVRNSKYEPSSLYRFTDRHWAVRQKSLHGTVEHRFTLLYFE